jgi:hypothetical protein
MFTAILAKESIFWLVYRKDLGKPVSLSGTFNASVFNSLWYIVTGKRYELDDPEFGEAISLLNT